MYADMHIHTYFSDGTHTPEEVAEVAKGKGIGLISVCDHNSIEAYDRLKPACRALGLTLVQGVELNAEWNGKDLHVLAYNFDPTNKNLLALVDRNHGEFEREGLHMIKNMAKEYPDISIASYDKYEKPVGRGGWKSINYLYDIGISKDLLEDGMRFHQQYGWAMKFESIEDACAIIRSAGGVPVLAHPGMYWKEDELADKLEQLVSAGIGGVECYYPVHNESFTAKCVEFCKTHALCVTCGCDGHGEFAQNVRGVFCDIGVLTIDVSLLNLEGIA